MRVLLICLCFFSLIGCMNTNWKDFEELKDYRPLTHEDYLKEYTYLSDENHLFQSTSYEELLELLDTNFTGVIYIGGAWCKNCQAAAPYINQAAKDSNLSAVYHFDTVIGVINIRNCANEHERILYRKLVDKLQYVNEKTVIYEENGKEIDSKISSIYVPTILVYNNATLVDVVTKEYVYEEMSDKDRTDLYQSYRNAFQKIK